MSQQIDHFIDPQHPVQAGTGGISETAGVTDNRLYHHADTEYADFSDIQDYVNPDHPSMNTFPKGMDFVKKHVEPKYASRARAFNQSTVLNPASCLVTGISVKEATGTGTASITLVSGTDGNQLPLMYITLAANESIRDFFPLPIESLHGVNVVVNSGSVLGVLYTREVTNVH